MTRRMDYCIILLILMIIAGCDEDGGGIAGIYNFTYDHKDFNQGCSMCNERYYFKFSDNSSGGRYYWIGVENQWGDILGFGRHKYITAPFSNATHFIDVSYSFKIDSSEGYYFCLYSTTDSFYVGSNEKDKHCGRFIIDSIIPITTIYNEPDCRQRCCTRGHRYAAVFRRGSGYTGARARMKARFGKLCGHEYNNFDTAFSVVHTGVAYETPIHYVIWAQFGFGKSRNQFDEIPPNRNFVYAEVNDYDSTQWCFYLDIIANDSTFDYDLELNQSTGTWTFTLDGVEKCALTSYDWYTTGNMVIWSGEVLNFEDDMAGTESNACVLSQCEYKETTWEDPNFDNPSNPPGIRRSDDEEWYIYIFDNETLHLYDRQPLM
jgi:hypothetical protein